ncbi:penicillin-binding protein 2 [Haloferula luteola]|uniref:Beta-lactamase n=1 Tax=Haloferula luteola TaxID=595692 RepID=A0A840V7I2_9BACT|nr:penicillin-binding transpeptidase domain-containing protein [Haloferula luteola]MBB5350698.1 penicillin-binding protein 2 [Haloferula luteola]
MNFLNQGIRVLLLTVMVLAGFGALVKRLYYFQITKQEHYQSLVPSDREVTVREPGIRGVIRDRNGIDLARNKRNFVVFFDLEEIRRSYLQQHEQDPKQQKLTTEDGMPRKTVETNIVQIVNTWIIPKLNELGLAKNYSGENLQKHYNTYRGLVPYTYNAGLTYEQFAKLAEHSLEVPGVYLDVRPEREYPYHALASHLLGYVQPWRNGEVPESEKRKFNHYIGDEKGFAGVEATLDDMLRGPAGSKTLVKNERGKFTALSDYRAPKEGAAVTLSIDARAQFLVTNTLRRAGRAAGVVMDVQTGEILAMASVPDYDPNDFIPSIDTDTWKAYNENPCRSLVDRSISAFAPGSTFKLATSLTGALNGLATRSFSCDGYVTYGNYKPACWLWNQSHGSHGLLTLPQAIQKSCNPYFYKLGNTLGEERMVAGFTMLGFGRPTGVRLPNESPGNLPGSKAWKRFTHKNGLTPGDIAQLAIGQGDSLATPLQLCTMVSAIANGGRYYRPRLVKKVVAIDGQVLIDDQPELRFDLIQEGVDPSQLELIRKGMWMAVNEAGGTAGRAKIPGVEIAGKTGTAQTADDGRRSHNSWTVAFGPFENPKYAVAVVVQNGKSGGKVCGPLVHLIFRGLLARDEGMQLPLAALDPVEGNRDPIEEIPLPEDVMAAIDVSDVGETADDVDEPIEVRPTVTLPNQAVIPDPIITPEVDEEGSVVPENPQSNDP